MSESKRFTVGELIKELEKLPADMPVLIRGYEDGYNDVSGLTAVKSFYENFYSDRYYGKHQRVDSVYYETPKDKFDGVIIS